MNGVCAGALSFVHCPAGRTFSPRHLLNKCLLSECWVPGIALGARNTAVNKTGSGPILGALKKELIQVNGCLF